MIKSKHKLSFCEACDINIVICAACGNNCCNGGSGKINGIICNYCDEAYKHQEIYWNGGEIEFS